MKTPLDKKYDFKGKSMNYKIMFGIDNIVRYNEKSLSNKCEAYYVLKKTRSADPSLFSVLFVFENVGVALQGDP